MLAHQDLANLREATRDDIFTTIPHSRLIGPPPARQWMVEGAFPQGTVAMVSGDGGIGKSMILQQLLTSAVLGLPWLGLTTRAGRGLFIGCEDDEDELHARHARICRSLGRDPEDPLEAGLELAGRVGRDNTLSRLERKSWRMETTELFGRVLQFVLRTGMQYVVIDTATQTFAGNQNDEQQVVQFINQLRRLAVAIQGIVIITKHPSLSGRSLGTGESGNTAWNNSVRSRLYLRKDKAGLALKTMKSNYGPGDGLIPLRWGRGVFEVITPELARDYTEAQSYR